MSIFGNPQRIKNNPHLPKKIAASVSSFLIQEEIPPEPSLSKGRSLPHKVLPLNISLLKEGAYNKGFSPITHYLSPITSLFKVRDQQLHFIPPLLKRGAGGDF